MDLRISGLAETCQRFVGTTRDGEDVIWVEFVFITYLNFYYFYKKNARGSLHRFSWGSSNLT